MICRDDPKRRRHGSHAVPMGYLMSPVLLYIHQVHTVNTVFLLMNLSSTRADRKHLLFHLLIPFPLQDLWS